MDDDELLDQFPAAYAADPGVLARWGREHPHLAADFRALAAYHALAAARVPDTVPGVELHGPVRQGGMGVIREGVETAVKRSVAVKLCLAVDDPAGLFTAERETLAGLHHTSIVPVLSAGRHGPWLYFVMPLIDGATLAHLVKRACAAGPGPLPPLAALVAHPDPPGDVPPAAVVRPGTDYLRSCAGVMVQAADAVAYAHEQGVWHLDLKPSNLMVEDSGHAWVIDFGLSRDAAGPPAAGDHLTAAYAAPEQPEAGDARSDVWGLGATLYELLTLRRPFGIGRPAGSPVPPRDVSPDVPRDLQAICLKALARRPEDRYEKAAAFAADLRRWLDGEETAARPWPPLVRVRELARKHRAWAAAFAVSVLGLAASLTLMWREEQARTKQAAAEADKVAAQATARREEDAAARARAWRLVEQARDRLAQPTPGRRADVRRLLLDAGRQWPPGQDDARAFALALRSAYAQSLGLLDVRSPPPAGRLPGPWTTRYEDWPADIHPDGHTLVLGTTGDPVAWRKDGPKPAADRLGGAGPRGRVTYGPTGDVLAEVRPPVAGGGLRVWDGAVTRRLGVLVEDGSPEAAVLAVGFDPKKPRLLAASVDGRVRAWALPSLAPLTDRWVEVPAGTSAAAFSAGGGWVAFGGRDGRVVVADATGSPVTRFPVPSRQPVAALAWTPNGRRLAVGTRDGEACVLTRAGVPEYRVPVSPSGVAHLAFSPDGRWLFADYPNGQARVWDAVTGQPVLFDADPIRGVARDGRTVVMSTAVEATFGELILPGPVDWYTGHRSAVNHLVWAPDGGRLATLASDFEVRVWDTARPGAAAAFAGPPSAGFWAQQSAIALGSEGQQVAYASGGLHESRVVIWDVATGERFPAWVLPGGFETLAPAGPGRFLSVRDETNPVDRNLTTVVRELEVGRPLPPGRVIRLPEPFDRRRRITHHLTPDGRYYLWSGPREPAVGRRVELYETATGRRVWRVVPPTAINDFAPTCFLTPDRRTLLVGDGTDEYRYALPSDAPPDKVSHKLIALSGDGRLALTAVAGNGYTAAAALGPVGGHARVEFPLRDRGTPVDGHHLFSPDGRHLAWGEPSGLVTVIDLPALEAELAQFEADFAARR